LGLGRFAAGNNRDKFCWETAGLIRTGGFFMGQIADKSPRLIILAGIFILPARQIMKKTWLENIRNFIVHYFGGLYNRVNEHHLFLLGGGLAFSLFVCIVPFVLIIFSLLGNILQSTSLQNQLDLWVEQIIPYENYATFVKNFIFLRIEEFKSYKNIAGLVGAIGLFLAASGLFSSIRTILNRIYKYDRGRFPLLGKLQDLGMVLLVLLFFLAATAIFPALGILKEYAQKIDILKILRFSGMQSGIIYVASYLLIFTLFYTIYSLVPYARLGFKVPAMSAFWAASMWEAARQLFGYYITHMASLKQIYGTYVLLVVVAFWIYYSSIVFILGAEIGQLYRERHPRF
jgi:membrane protein